MTQSAKYASVSAKIGAERSNILSESKLKALSESKDLNDFVFQLKDTVYQTQLARNPQAPSGRKLERAFIENLLETYIKIIKNSPPSVSAYLVMMLKRFEIENIKALIKAINTELAEEQKQAHIYWAVEDYFKRRPIFDDALKATDLKKLTIAFRKTEYALALVYGLKSYEENGATACFDVLVDKTYYEKLYYAYLKLPKREKSHALFYTNMESSSYILLTLLRGKTLNHDTNWLRVVIPDVHFLPNETIESIVMATDFETALKIVQKTTYSAYFEKAPTPEEIISNAEKTFKKIIYNQAKQGRVAETFNVGVPLAFMYLKQAEINNLITISLGVEAGLKPEDIQSLLLN